MWWADLNLMGTHFGQPGFISSHSGQITHKETGEDETEHPVMQK